ncbi:Protein sat1 [Cyphellophora attinorum]|uniref:Protein sat1 n=1 Tax=Cyphellophora attinorum TaxID=1664694 RepID=A0A0N1H5F5_9EURO|nr:Protein sat1 [Phialophora attinorum]KPI40950.1 Protein sat1 [Phialophora attinorum]
MPADIQVTVRFQDQCVFAGEEVKCTITFRNVANTSEPATPGPHQRRFSRTLSIEKLSATSPRFSDVLQSPRVGKANYPPSAMKKAIGSGPGTSGTANQRPGHKHQRSVSIISIGSPTVSEYQQDAGSDRPPMGGHRRSSTVQVHTGHDRQISSSLSSGLQIPPQSGRRSPLSSTSASTPVYESRRSTPDFQFPPQSQAAPSKQPSRDPSREPSPRTAGMTGTAVPTRLRREPSNASRVTSERSSGDFYSMSNHSHETLVSEQPSVLSERPQIQIPSAMMRRHYRMDTLPQTPRRPPPQPVDLMMGYAHLTATFTVDASLVDPSPFEEVKQKGFLGGQAGGGVVGVTQKKARPNSGFLGGFNFNSIGESLNSLVGGDNMSSVREMNAVSNSRAIPLLSTPQSLLFVNLHLEPGEEKSYSFSCPLPRGLPSSYRGKAVKFSYNIQIGVQSAPTSTRQPDHKVRQISIPVRVFPGVDSDGEILGHDLMQPHVLLRDPAKTASISATFPDSEHKDLQAKRPSTLIPALSNHTSALSSHDLVASHPTLALINRAIQLSSHRQLNSTNPSGNRFNITRVGQPVALITLSRPLLKLGETVHISVALASPTFDAPTLPPPIRTTSIHMSLETTEKVAQSLAVRSAVSIARVTRKIYASWGSGCVLNGKRVVWGVKVPTAMGTNVSPGFVTSGVGLEWGVRVEFGVLKSHERAVDDEGVTAGGGAQDEYDDKDDIGERSDDDKRGDAQQAQRRQGEEEDQQQRRMLQPRTAASRTKGNSSDDHEISERQTAEPQIYEQIVHDDQRGTISIAAERLDCDSFEVWIPLTVYGDVLPVLSNGEAGGEDDAVVKVISL